MIETRLRLVEQQHTRLLRERLREKGPLPLTSGEVSEAAIGETAEPHALQGLVDDPPVRPPHRPPHSARRPPAHRDGVADSDGQPVVSAAQDAIDGFALTAMGRILELMTYTLGVVLGILAGLEVARAVGLAMPPPTEALPLGPVPLQFVGAALIAVSVAVFNGAGGRIIAVSAALSVVAWLAYVLASQVGLEVAAASGIGAFAGSFVGTLIAYRVHVPSVAITTAAILPMVPGAAVFRGLLSIVESGESTEVLLAGFTTLAAAAIIGVSLAVGASLGIYLGQPVRASLRGVSRTRARLRR